MENLMNVWIKGIDISKVNVCLYYVNIYDE